MILPASQPVRSLADLGRSLQAVISAISASWNVDHKPNGTHGSVRADALYEAGRSVAMGTWTDVVALASRFTANGTMTWGVDTADANTYAFTRIGRTVMLQWSVVGSDVTAPVSTELRVAVPDGLVMRAQVRAMGFHWYQDAGGTGAVGPAIMLTGDPYVRLFKADLSNWTATAADNTTTQGSIVWQV